MVIEMDSIIFDFGNVIIPIDFERTLAAFRKLGLSLDADFSFLSQSPIFDQWDRGEVTSQNVLEFFRSKLPAHSAVTDDQLVSAWNAILGQLPLHRIEWLENLAKHYPLYLLSNTNTIHINYLRKNDPLMPRLEKIFKHTYYSYEMHLRKPDAACFLKVVKDQNLTIERTLFVDDHPKNIAAAQQLGFQTLHCTGEITQLLD